MTLFDLDKHTEPLPKPARPEVAAPTPETPQAMGWINGHDLSLIVGKYSCAICGVTWKNLPVRSCPGVKMYQWGKWPEHLLTKAQVGEAGYQTGKKLPPPAGGCYREKSPDGIMWLYDRSQCMPKRVLSDEQKAKNKAAMDQAKLCPRCGVGSRAYTVHTPRYRGGRQRGYYSEFGWWEYCQSCQEELDDAARRKSVASEFKRWLDKDCLILDTETTSLEGEIIELTVIDKRGEVLINQRIMPKDPQEILDSGAYKIHGIRPRDLGLCPTFHEVYPQLWPLLEGRLVVIYNKDFDIGRLQADCWRWGLPKLKFKSVCAMEEYSRYVGDWSDHWGNYRWQRLEGGDHSALGDCKAVLKLMQEVIQAEVDL